MEGRSDLTEDKDDAEDRNGTAVGDEAVGRLSDGFTIDCRDASERAFVEPTRSGDGFS